MASTKRSLPSEEDDSQRERESETKKAKVDYDSKNPPRVVLNPADCNLDFDIEEDGLKGSALHEGGFAYCWSGSRANVGITGGKYCFGLKVVSEQPVEMEDTLPDQQHVCRLGVSRGNDDVGSLGETDHSFGFGGTGKFSSARRFLDYGEKIGVGDVIVCAVDLESKPQASIGFSKNGRWLGTAMQFHAGLEDLGLLDKPIGKLKWDSDIFPHVLLKNVSVQLQFSNEDGLVTQEGYKPWYSAFGDGNAVMGPSFEDWGCYEVMMMVGLPASGKSTWAEKWMKEHPEKRYVLLGTNLLLDQMKVPGLLRKRNYGERFDRLIDRANQMLNTLLPRAAKTPHNYILDQTKVYRSARIRKLRPFNDFRKVAIVVFPSPEELNVRKAKRFEKMGKEVPPDAVNEMIANFVWPQSKAESNELFDEVKFVELNCEVSQRHLDDMMLALKKAFSGENLVEPCTSSLQNQELSLAMTDYLISSLYSSPLALNWRSQMNNQHPVNPAYAGVRSYYEPHQGYQTNPELRASAPYGAMVKPTPVASQVASSHTYYLYAGQFTNPGPPSTCQSHLQLRTSAPYGVTALPALVATQVAFSHAYNPHAGQFINPGPPFADLHPTGPPFAPRPVTSSIYGSTPALPPSCPHSSADKHHIPPITYKNPPPDLRHPGGYPPYYPRSY